MTLYLPTSVASEVGDERPWLFHGAAPWLNTRDKAASYIEADPFHWFWIHFGGSPAGPVTVKVQAWIIGTARMECFWDEATEDLAVDLHLFEQIAQATGPPPIDIGTGADPDFGIGRFANAFVSPGGPISLFCHMGGLGGLHDTYLSYFALNSLALPPRRINPRDDGRAGSSTPRSTGKQTEQASNRVVGGYL